MSLDEHMSYEETHEDAEEIESYYLMLDAGIVPELDWTCPGKRAPTPDGCANSNNNNSNKDIDNNNTVCNIETQEPQKANDFDFSDDVAQPQLRVRHQSATPKSAKKKTANFAGVMEVLKKKNAEVTT